MNTEIVKKKRIIGTPFKKGNPGKPKGAVSKQTTFRNWLFKIFENNRSQAERMLNEMFTYKNDFKWVMELLSSFVPKEIKGEGFGGDKYIFIVKDKESAEGRGNNRIPFHTTQESTKD